MYRDEGYRTGRFTVCFMHVFVGYGYGTWLVFTVVILPLACSGAQNKAGLKKAQNKSSFHPDRLIMGETANVFPHLSNGSKNKCGFKTENGRVTSSGGKTRF